MTAKEITFFPTYKDFYKFIMNYEGDLVVRNGEIYENEVLIGMITYGVTMITSDATMVMSGDKTMV